MIEEGQSLRAWVLPEAIQYLMDDGDHEAVAAILSSFRTDTTRRLELLYRAVESGDAAQIRTQAHAIAGSARSVGADAMAEVCRETELAAADPPGADLRKLWELIRERFQEACRGLQIGD
jgi:HPt (histidine-containing phosphotransfer) domain-containing protein